MPTPCYISIEGKTQGNITAGAFTSDSVGNIFVQGIPKYRSKAYASMGARQSSAPEVPATVCSQSLLR